MARRFRPAAEHSAEAAPLDAYSEPDFVSGIIEAARRTSTGLAWAGGVGLLVGAGWKLIAVALPFSLLWIGQRVYVKLDDARLRRAIWTLLALLGTLGVTSAVIRIVR